MTCTTKDICCNEGCAFRLREITRQRDLALGRLEFEHKRAEELARELELADTRIEELLKGELTK